MSINKSGKGSWVQTERKAHEKFAELIRVNPTGARLMHLLVSLMDKKNSVVVSQTTLGKLLGRHRNSVSTAVKSLESGNWIQTTRLGSASGGVKAYHINRRVAWADKRENQRFAYFDARVIASESEQLGTYALQADKQLNSIPQVGETQVPTGVGLDPPSQPSLSDELTPDLPASLKGDGHLQEKLV